MVSFADGGEVAAHTVVLATGVSYNTLDAPGINQLTGRGVFYGVGHDRGPRTAPTRTSTSSAAPTRPARPPASPARRARQVTLVVRADGLERVHVSRPDPPDPRGTANIGVLPNTLVAGAEGDEHLRAPAAM